MFYTVFTILALLIPSLAWGYYLVVNLHERAAVKELATMLFPEGDDQRETVMQDLMKLTKDKYSRVQLLDYYLKIKGLHLIDLHTSASSRVRAFLMQPTKIKLNYSELVQFYEKFLNLPQSTGIDATVDY